MEKFRGKEQMNKTTQVTLVATKAARKRRLFYYLFTVTCYLCPVPHPNYIS